MDADMKAKVVEEWKSDPLMMRALGNERLLGSSPEVVQDHQVLAIRFGIAAGLPWQFAACPPEELIQALENHEFNEEVAALLGYV
jgi:hypothetical protein